MQLLLLVLTLVLALMASGTAAEPASTPAPKSSAPVPEGTRDLEIGEKAPDFSLLGIDDKKHTLAEYSAPKVLMIAFLSNHCPDSHAAETRIKKLLEEMKDQSFGFIAINPNSPEGLSINELGYSKYNDGFDDMKKYAADSGFTFPYLYDGDTQAVAKDYGCLATPHIFIFDAERKLRYKGQFDDSRYADPSTVKSSDARNATLALLAGKPLPVEVTKPHGCSTKWIMKKGTVSKLMDSWDKTSVDLDPIDAAGLTALRTNGAKKVRLFNVWSTTCPPCVAEFPELVTTARKFDMREFEFITISTDEPQDAPKAKTFLEKHGAGLSSRAKKAVAAENRKTNSYIYQGADVSELMKALDPSWPGGFPHTVLVGAKNEIIWSHNGLVDGDELRAKILEYMGPYYQP